MTSCASATSTARSSLRAARTRSTAGPSPSLISTTRGRSAATGFTTSTTAARLSSTFHQLPTREHLTIRLNDEQVASFNETQEAAIPQGVTDKIVRVLYDCTDEHNKAFNHAAYENMLYAAGVFWVQEITPQKITITVDRRSMDADGTPEGNLTDYLAEKEYTPERIGELVELARPADCGGHRKGHAGAAHGAVRPGGD